MIKPYLEDLERRIDPETEEQLQSEWQNFTAGHVIPPFFSPRRKRKIPSGLQWPSVTVNQAIDDPELMMLQQLAACSAVLASDRGSLLNIRANFGTGIMSSLFGAPIFRMDDALDTLPTTMPLVGGADAIRRLVDEGEPDLLGGYCTTRSPSTGDRDCVKTRPRFTRSGSLLVKRST